VDVVSYLQDLLTELLDVTDLALVVLGFVEGLDDRANELDQDDLVLVRWVLL
jgi:hypothetical protein